MWQVGQRRKRVGVCFVGRERSIASMEWIRVMKRRSAKWLRKIVRMGRERMRMRVRINRMIRMKTKMIRRVRRKRMKMKMRMWRAVPWSSSLVFAGLWVDANDSDRSPGLVALDQGALAIGGDEANAVAPVVVLQLGRVDVLEEAHHDTGEDAFEERQPASGKVEREGERKRPGEEGEKRGGSTERDKFELVEAFKPQMGGLRRREERGRVGLEVLGGLLSEPGRE